MEQLSINVVVHEENTDKGKVFIVNNEELGISDFGDNLDEAMSNFRKSMQLYLDTYPEKKEVLIEKQENPPLVTSILL